ncbi:class I SAM-dependent methyltransferase [Bradyrhizobium guangzhouense]|uniref:class I SAM-dependent methyltransferase n=1 Tax=Bradyrhizobium guangzhouense TaxID=1325095 RepID=UPI0013E8EA34|nr:class I SAM-dependent methyltransferase [Bradyrhizobium guangzhouense]
MQITYNPDIFTVRNAVEAKAIILTAETSTTEARWERETPWTCDLIAAQKQLGAESVVLDYGCGIGRMSKALIERHGCRVVGVDISPSMRALSVEYVGSDRFFACSPVMLDLLIGQGLQVDLAISVWVLQHCLTPADDIRALRNAVRPGGGLFIVNNVHRAVPSREQGWINDGVDIKATLARIFQAKDDRLLHSPDVPSSLSGNTYWAYFEKAES